MRVFLLVLTLLILPGFTTAKELPEKSSIQTRALLCSLNVVVHDWNFAEGDQGFWTRECDIGGFDVWEHGSTSYILGAPPRVWGTVLNGDYPNEAGYGLVSPRFTVTEASNLLEVYHYYDIEDQFDGCNVIVGEPFPPPGNILTPMSGYTGIISTSSSFYAYCLDNEPGWTGPESGGTPYWRTDCFDLTPYMGLEIEIEFDFGADVSVTRAGWYIGRVRVGASARRCPDLQIVMIDWDFVQNDGGFHELDCQIGGQPGWEWGPESTIPNSPGRVWGTILNGLYPDDGGMGLISPPFPVTQQSYMVEFVHYFDFEPGYDGGNIIIGPWLPPPPPIEQLYPFTHGGYTEVILPYANCVKEEWGYTRASGGWRRDCIDLSDHIGEEVQIEFDYGSDLSVRYPGWYLARVRVGGMIPDAVEDNESLIGDHGSLRISPNPSRGVTQLIYALDRPEEVVFEVYDIGGRIVRSLIPENSGSRHGSAIWDGHSDAGSRVQPGVYFCRLKTTTRSICERMIILE